MKKEYDFYRGTKIIMDDRFFKLTTDTVLLSSFVKADRGEKGIDLGCGIGSLGLLCELKNPGVCVDGIEIIPEAAALAAENYKNCGGAGKIITGDVTARGFENEYDFAVTNPPYFEEGGGKKSLSPGLSLARHGNFKGFFEAAQKAVKKSGRLYFCIRYSLYEKARRDAEGAGFYLSRARFVCEREGAPAATALCEGVKIPAVTAFETPLVLRDGTGYTKEYKDIYGIR